MKKPKTCVPRALKKNKLMDLTKKIFLLIFTFFILSPFFVKTVFSQTMSNSSYIIQMGNLNSGAGISTGSNYRLNQTLGQTGANLFSGANYKVRAGFQYVLSIIAFKFTIQNIIIDFGTVSPTTPVLRTSLLTVSNGSSGGYQVTVSENHQLLVPSSGQMIPDTSCDSGNTCTTTTANHWSSSLTYGFGYRCDNVSGTDCDSQFLTGSDYYRPFAASPSAVMVMSSSNVGSNKQSTVTYKLNISGSQAAGLYTNVINYIATPTF